MVVEAFTTYSSFEYKTFRFKEGGVTFFKWFLENKNKCNMRTYLSSGSANRDAVEVFYRISYRIARSGKNHTIGENLFFQALETLCLVCLANP